ncbi:hypothetical protein ACQJBY_005340 [Aegilops geniculata]
MKGSVKWQRVEFLSYTKEGICLASTQEQSVPCMNRTNSWGYVTPPIEHRAGTRGSLEARPAPVSSWQPRPAPGAKFEETGLAHLIRRQTLKKQFKST